MHFRHLNWAHLLTGVGIALLVVVGVGLRVADADDSQKLPRPQFERPRITSDRSRSPKRSLRRRWPPRATDTLRHLKSS
jgi:hypothetical protein